MIFNTCFYISGITDEQAEAIARKVGLEDQLGTTVDLLKKLYKLAIDKDALLIEVNPYAEDVNGGCNYIINVKPYVWLG